MSPKTGAQIPQKREAPTQAVTSLTSTRRGSSAVMPGASVGRTVVAVAAAVSMRVGLPPSPPYGAGTSKSCVVSPPAATVTFAETSTSLP